MRTNVCSLFKGTAKGHVHLQPRLNVVSGCETTLYNSTNTDMMKKNKC